MELRCCFILFLVSVSSSFVVLNATSAHDDPIYKACIGHCEKTGCVAEKCFKQCNFSSDGLPAVDGPWYLQEPLYRQWKKWDCQSDCQYHCMLDREQQRHKLGLRPAKYQGKWPLQRVYGMQEPVSVALSGLDLAIQFHGWISFFILINYKLPLKADRGHYYKFAGLWHIYAILSMNAWFWNTVSHCRDVELIVKFDISSAVALLGFSVIVSILRVFNVRAEASRVMIAAPIIAVVVTHILYLNFFNLDYRLNAIFCGAISTAQIILWAVWAGVSKHPSCRKLWVVVVGGALATLLEVYDFPPYRGYIDAHAVWHATAIPLSYMWWSFVRDDSEFVTNSLLRKSK